jgi:hypothetical protein
MTMPFAGLVMRAMPVPGAIAVTSAASVPAMYHSSRGDSSAGAN